MSQSGRGGSPNGSPGRRSAGRRRTALRAAAILFALALGASPWLVWRALQAPRVPVPPRAPRVLRDVTVIEPGRSRRRHRDLVIADGRIRTERASHARVDGDGGSGGGFVLPGLIDLHVHYPPRVAAGNAELWSLLFLAHGVTSLRETGSIDGSIFEVRREIRAGRTPGPRIFACGPMLDGDPPSFPSNRVVRSAADADRAVDALAADGADCVKVYNMLSREALHAIHRAAKRHALPVIGHKPHAVSLEEAHISDLQHLTGAPEVDVERVARQDFRFEDWWTVDERRMQYVERVSLAQGIAYTPTLVNAHLRALLLDPSRANGDSGLRHLPRFWQTVWPVIWALPFDPDVPEGRAAFDVFRERLAALTVRLHRAGVRIHAGTDTLMPYVAPGSGLHGELRGLVDAGLSPEEAWTIATRQNAEALPQRGLGTLAAAAPADLLLFREDPTRDLAALDTLELVVSDGRAYPVAALRAELARYDEHFHGAFYEAVMGALTSLIRGGFAPDG